MEELRVSDGDERNLVHEALAGDEKAFRTILETHYSLICSVVHSIARERGETEDIVQEVFIKIFRALRDFRGDSRLSTWIFRIARNEALNAVARRAPLAVPIEDCEDLPGAGEDPEEIRRKSAVREHIGNLMGRLDENQRMALELRYAGEKSYEEIAEIMEIPLGTVKTHIYRAKLSLKRMMTGTSMLEKGRSQS